MVIDHSKPLSRVSFIHLLNRIHPAEALYIKHSPRLALGRAGDKVLVVSLPLIFQK